MRQVVISILLTLLLAGGVFAQGTILPSPYQVVLDANGKPVSGARITVYLAGTTTAATTYADAGLTTPNTSPIVADSAGRYVCFLPAGQSFKISVATAAGVVIRTVDGIQATPYATGNLDLLGTAGEALSAGDVVYLSAGAGGLTAGKWYKADADNAYSSTLPTVGMVPSSIVADASGTIRLAGSVSGLSSLVAGSTYYISATAGGLTATAPGNARIVGAADTAISMVLSVQSGQSTTIATSTATGTQNDWAPGIVGNTVVRLNNASLLTIQGISSTNVLSGTRVLFVSVGAGQVDFAHQNGSSAAANRLINQATSGTTSLAPGTGTAEYSYDGTTQRWRLVSHEQGAAITPTFAAGNFTGASAMTWTVASGDVVTYTYLLRGRRLTVDFVIDTTTVGGTPSGLLQIAIPNGYTATRVTYAALAFLGDNSTTQTLGHARVNASGTVIQISRYDAGVFSASTDATYVRGQMTLEIN